MRVKCIDKGSSKILEVSKIYEMYEEINDKYLVQTELGATLYLKKYFEIIKEDKMENRIVRKLEDLDGLENGFGAKIQRIENSIYMQVWVNDKSLYDFNISEVSGERYFNDVIGVLKAMGFKFEFQKLRTVEEVLEEMKTNSLNPYCDNLFEVRCEFNYEKNESIYSVFKNIHSVTLGAYVFSKETAQKYADELNEIVRGAK